MSITREYMIQETFKFWKENCPQWMKKKSQKWLQKEAAAAADLTQMEMNVLMKTYGISSEEPWAESRNLFCMKVPNY